MVFLSLVASHSDIDLETVAQLSAGASQVASSVLETSAPLNGIVVLSTCNRYEVYCEASGPGEIEAARSAVISQISSASGLSEHVVGCALATKTGQDTVEHLFNVGAGLDSAVIGEREIAGQLRRALIEAQEKRTASGSLVRLFQTASRTAKEVGTRTELGSRGLSIVSVALDLASDLSVSAGWAEKNIVVFGTGAYAGATMALLRERGAHRVGVYSSSGRAETFVSTRGGSAVDEEQLQDALSHADVIIGCSGGDRRLMAADVASLDRAGRPLIAVDLALTHDFDPAFEDLDNVDLITLESVRMAAPVEQAMALRQARQIVQDAATDFAQEQRQRSADAAIVALRKHTQSVLESEVEKVRAQHGCTAAADEVEFAMRRMMRQLLHVPTVRGRELAAEGRTDDYVAALETLYGIQVQAPRAVPAQTPPACPVGEPAAPLREVG
ncbi:glutamyl-tRNA reductase [Paeniglutamicibacter cryotolerans]|uniref:Glutamyl-tRNA reductase n=1 Tax=Paeniglutamicibacter cryotolerans TaxID=670079 RepID=A0A839QJF1_9MICC|nr:glutamyl-tRNA reductase [Paeniglutamicibacter cryotolerans]MBB2996538.1 glutamyl-tRNA reductase [Paeniglutamicibacter cryotolerans]